jgi:PAS domain S-box-containing protein
MHDQSCDNRIYNVVETLAKNTRFGPVKVAFFHDITESHAKDLELRSKTQLLESVANNSPALIYVKDRVGTYLFVNKHFNTLLGSEFSYLAGKTDFDFFPEQTARQFQLNDQYVLNSGKIATFQENISHEGMERYYISVKFPLFDVQNIPYAVGGITTDITERTQMEMTLQYQNEQLLSLINASPDIIIFKDDEGRWLLANDGMLRLFELEHVDYLGRTDAELAEYAGVSRDTLTHCTDTDQLTWKNKRITQFTEQILRPDRTKTTFEIVKVPLFYSDGRRKRLVVIGRDISQSIKASMELEEKNKKIHETNIALKVLVDQQQDKCLFQAQQIQTTLKRLVFPYIDKLAHVAMEENGREYVQLVSAHLHALADSFCRRLDDPVVGLSPKELLVADLVRQGKSSRSIAKLLGLTERTVEVYRNAIRKKIKIGGQKINLMRFLKDKFSI